MGDPKSKSDSRFAFITVVFTAESLKEIIHTAACERGCYGNSTMAHTVAMEKILKAMAQKEEIVII